MDNHRVGDLVLLGVVLQDEEVCFDACLEIDTVAHACMRAPYQLAKSPRTGNHPVCSETISY